MAGSGFLHEDLIFLVNTVGETHSDGILRNAPALAIPCPKFDPTSRDAVLDVLPTFRQSWEPLTLNKQLGRVDWRIPFFISSADQLKAMCFTPAPRGSDRLLF